MTESSEDSGLHEYVDAEFVIEDLKTPTQEKTLYATLENLNGVHNVTIKGGKVSVKYEPVCMTEKEIVVAIEGTGFRIADANSAASSPMTDAFVSGSQPREKPDAAK
jgi:copper chaperone CopZ